MQTSHSPVKLFKLVYNQFYNYNIKINNKFKLTILVYFRAIIGCILPLGVSAIGVKY